jgi:Peptidase family M23
MTTLVRRIALPAFLFLVWTPVAKAWSWPVQGRVVAPFAYDAAHPYASGQHRGIDIGADATGESVVAPASGTVSFAGPVPTNGTSLTIETTDGYSVTLTHLGSIVVTKGASVTEGDEVGTIGPSGTPEADGPYVHLGIRTTSDPNGYLDPLSLLPPVPDTTTSGGGSTASQPVATQPSAGSSSPPAPAPASQNQPAPPATATTPAAPASGSIARTTPAHVSRHARGSVPTTHSDARPQSTSKRPPAAQTVRPRGRVPHRPRLPHRDVSAPMPASRRPVVEVAAPGEPAGVDAGHRAQLDAQIEHSEAQPELRNTSSPLLSLVCNGAAALVAAGAALAAGRTHRRHLARRVSVAQVLHLPHPKLDRHMRRAA